MGRIAHSAKEVLYGGYHSDNFLELSSLVDAGSLIPGQYHEDSLAGLPNAAQVAPGVRGELFCRRPGVGGGFLHHRRLELVQPGKNEGGTTNPVFSAGRENHSCANQFADPLAGGHHHLRFARSHHDGLLDDVAGPGALAREPVGKGIGDLQRLQLHRRSIDPIPAEKGKDLPGIAGDLGLCCGEVVARAHVPQGPERQIGGDLSLGPALYFDISIGGASAGKSMTNDPPAERHAEGYQDGGDKRAISQGHWVDLRSPYSAAERISGNRSTDAPKPHSCTYPEPACPFRYSFTQAVAPPFGLAARTWVTTSGLIG